MSVTLLRSAAAELHRPGREDLSAYGRWHSPDTPVAWASVTKLFLASTVRALVARDALSWDTCVGDVLHAEAPASLTVRSLVEHRSGLPRLLPEQSRQVIDPYTSWTHEQFDAAVLPRLAALVGESAGEEEYSNLGYALLTRVVESSQQQPWLDLLRALVIEPLGVDPALFTLGGSGRDGQPVVLSRSLWGSRQWDWDLATGPFSGAGGLCTTVPAMREALVAALGQPSELDPRRTPHAWVRVREGVYSMHGGLMRCGSVVAVEAGSGKVGVAHAVGGMAGRGAEHAEAALTRLAEASNDEAVA